MATMRVAEVFLVVVMLLGLFGILTRWSDSKAVPIREIRQEDKCECNITSSKPTQTSAMSWQQRLGLVQLQNIFMDAPEVAVIMFYMQDAKSYLEYGSGGSTLNFAPYAAR